MNFLAHIFLSGNSTFVRLGNFFADGVKGKQYLAFPKDVQTGILLHRAIDTYTDSHPIVRQSTRKLHSKYSHYSGIIVDIFYDHFLAKHWGRYSKVSLKQFTTDFYDEITTHFDILPKRYKAMTPIMIEHNWLLSYASFSGIQNVLNGMNQRTLGQSKMNEATKELTLYYKEFEDEFFRFFASLIDFSNLKLNNLTSKE